MTDPSPRQEGASGHDVPRADLLNRFGLLAFLGCLLLPVFWTPRVQAVDMASHTYGAWLTSSVRAGAHAGVSLERVHTNLLVDVMLQGLLLFTGPVWAERIAMSMALLAFVLGAWFWLRAVERNAQPWTVAPLLLVAAHGTVTQTGLVNFLLAMGLGAGAGACLIHGRRWWIAAIPLAAAAWIAHAMGTLIILAMTAYSRVHRSLGRTERVVLLLLAAGAIAISGMLLEFLLETVRVHPPLGFLGLYGLVPYRALYMVPALLYLGIAGWSAFGSLRTDAGGGVGLHFFLLCAVAYQVYPSGFHVPSHGAWVTFLSQRIELGVFLAVIVMAATAARPRAIFAVGLLVAASYFSLLRSDHHLLAQHDALLKKAVLEAPSGARLVFPHRGEGYFVDPLRTALDRACLGHCYNFFHYRPSTGHFRMVAVGPNPFFVWRYEEIAALNQGVFVFTDAYPPLLAVRFRDGAYRLEEVTHGERLSREPLHLRGR